MMMLAHRVAAVTLNRDGDSDSDGKVEINRRPPKSHR